MICKWHLKPIVIVEEIKRKVIIIIKVLVANQIVISFLILMPKPLYLLYKKVRNPYIDILIDPKMVISKETQNLCEKALTTKGMWNYLKGVKE